MLLFLLNPRHGSSLCLVVLRVGCKERWVGRGRATIVWSLRWSMGAERLQRLPPSSISRLSKLFRCSTTCERGGSLHERLSGQRCFATLVRRNFVYVDTFFWLK